GDVDGDGRPDVLYVSAYNGDLWVRLQDPGHPEEFLPAMTFAMGGMTRQLVLADVDGDGFLDALAALDDTGIWQGSVPLGTVVVVRGDPQHPGAFLPPSSFPAIPHANYLALGD